MEQPTASTSKAASTDDREPRQHSPPRHDQAQDRASSPRSPKRRRTNSSSQVRGQDNVSTTAAAASTTAEHEATELPRKSSTGAFSIASITHSDSGSIVVPDTQGTPSTSSHGAAQAGSSGRANENTASTSAPTTNREEESPNAGVARSSAGRETRPAAVASADNTYELKVLQQPEIGADAGMDRNTLNRLPIVPAPVVQVVVRNQAGEEVSDIDLPYLFCMCRLLNEDGSSLPPLEEPPSWARAGERIDLLLGGLARNAHQFTDAEGKNIAVFVFEDVSVRQQGRFTLEFRLGEARPESPRLAAVTSDVFEVVPWQEYPRRAADDVLTDLSRRLHEQGIPMYIPPLTLNLPEAPAPTPSSLPFDDADPALARRESRVSVAGTSVSAAPAQGSPPSSTQQTPAGGPPGRQQR